MNIIFTISHYFIHTHYSHLKLAVKFIVINIQVEVGISIQGVISIIWVINIQEVITIQCNQGEILLINIRQLRDYMQYLQPEFPLKLDLQSVSQAKVNKVLNRELEFV